MNTRRDFLRRMAFLTAGTIAADQLEIVERLGWTHKFFPAAVAPAHINWICLSSHASTMTVSPGDFAKLDPFFTGDTMRLTENSLWVAGRTYTVGDVITT